MKWVGFTKHEKVKVELRDGRVRDKAVWSRIEHRGRDRKRVFYIRYKERGFVRIEKLDRPYRTSKLASFQVGWKEAKRA